MFYKIIYAIKLGTYEAIVGSNSEEEALEMLNESLYDNGFTTYEIKDVYKLDGRGVLVTKYLRQE